MGLLLYAITTPPTTEPSRRTLSVKGLTAWTSSDLGPGSPAFARADVLEHHRVVTEVFEQVEACLPARFPTVLADEATLCKELEARGAELASQLEKVRGACELAVTAVWTSPEAMAAAEVDSTSPGRRYLLRRQAELTASEHRRSRAEELASALEQEVGTALREAERQLCPSRDVALSLALLVDRASAHAVLARLRDVGRQDVRILVHGPWPAYTFVRVRSTSGRE